MENIIITGGTGNLGQTVVKTLSEKDYKLHLAVRKQMSGDGDHVLYYQTDLLDDEQSKQFVQKIVSENPDIQAGVFLAGAFDPGSLDKSTTNQVLKMIDVNFVTAFNVARELVAYYKTVGGGKLIFIGAKAAMDFKTAGSSLAYSLSKQLLYNFSDLINESEKSAGISSHILLPGIIDTVTNREAMPDADFSAWIKPDVIANVIDDIISGKESRLVITL